jgi:hypothetical protein
MAIKIGKRKKSDKYLLLKQDFMAVKNGLLS